MTVIEVLVNPTFAAMVSGLAGLVAGYVMKRVEKAPDVQASLDKAVAGVVDHYVKALSLNHEEMKELRGEIRAMRETIADLEEHIDLLTTALEKAGVTPPPRRKRAGNSA